MKQIFLLFLVLSFSLFISGCSKKNNMRISSPSFKEDELMAKKYTCDGENISPKIEIDEVPAETKSLALSVIDPDSPSGNFVHWLMWNIDPQIKAIEENIIPQGAIEGTTSWNRWGYGGPCPSTGTHRYVFKIYALDTELNLKNNNGWDTFENTIKGHVIDSAVCTGKYGR